jgi:hypothetical protein
MNNRDRDLIKRILTSAVCFDADGFHKSAKELLRVHSSIADMLDREVYERIKTNPNELKGFTAKNAVVNDDTYRSPVDETKTRDESSDTEQIHNERVPVGLDEVKGGGNV